MKLVTAISTAVLLLAPAVGHAQAPANDAQAPANDVQAPANDAGDTKDQPGLVNKVEHMIGKITGSSPDTKEGAGAKSGNRDSAAKSGDRDSAAKSAGNTNYPDWAAVKKTDK